MGSEEKKDIVVSTSPSELMRLAVDKGTDLDKLEKLLSLQISWEANEAKKAYHIAMAEFKAKPPKIEKTKKVSFGAGKTAYKHATLYNVTDKINTELSKHGLSAGWTTNQVNGTISVTCTITHSKGHGESTTLTASADTSGSKNAIQAIGSTVSYLQRYTLLSLTGLATHDMDDDGQSAECITEDQIRNLKSKLNEKNIDIKKFLAYMGVDDIAKIPQAKYKIAETSIKNTKKRV